jgi:hypothetical protein
LDALTSLGCIAHSNQRDVLIVGSTQPWHESLLLNACPSVRVHTIDYNRLTYEHDRLSTSTVIEWLQQQTDARRQYDAILTILALEHDGLGYVERIKLLSTKFKISHTILKLHRRYGDPINPDADLDFMAILRCSLKPGLSWLTAFRPLAFGVLFLNFMSEMMFFRRPSLFVGCGRGP